MGLLYNQAIMHPGHHKLYTNIPHNEGIQSTKKMLAIHKPPDSLPHNSYIIEFLE